MVQKSKHVYSLIALDQNHEQENESVKGVTLEDVRLA